MKRILFLHILLFLGVLCSYSIDFDFSQKFPQEELTKFIPFYGKVVDVNGVGIPDVSINIFGSTLGGVSGIDGKFEVKIPEKQRIGLCFQHIKYIPKSVYIDSLNQKDEIEIVLKESICLINFIEEEFFCPSSEIDRNLPVPKIKLAEDEEVYIVEEFPEFPGGSANLYKRYKEEVKHQLSTVIPEKILRGVYHGTILIDKTGLMDLLDIKENVTAIQMGKIKEFFRRIGKWKPGFERGKPVEMKFTFIIEFKGLL